MNVQQFFAYILIGFMLILSVGMFTDQVIANAQSVNATVIDRFVALVFAPVYSGFILGWLGVGAYLLYKEVS